MFLKGGVKIITFDIITLGFFILSVLFLLKAYNEDKVNYLKSKSSILYLIFIILILLEILRIFTPLASYLSALTSLILLYYSSYFESKVVINTNILKIKKQIEEKDIVPRKQKLDVQREELHQSKKTLERERDLVRERDIQLENQKQDVLKQKSDLNIRD